MSLNVWKFLPMMIICTTLSGRSKSAELSVGESSSAELSVVEANPNLINGLVANSVLSASDLSSTLSDFKTNVEFKTNIANKTCFCIKSRIFQFAVYTTLRSDIFGSGDFSAFLVSIFISGTCFKLFL